MSKNRAAVIEVGSDEDSLRSFRSEAEKSPPTLGPVSGLTRLLFGWGEGFLLFASGLVTGALFAAVLTVEWPARTSAAAVDAESGPVAREASTPGANAPNQPPRPVATGGAEHSPVITPEVRPVAGVPPPSRGTAGSVFRGSLTVTSQPRGARLFINNRYVGRTPMTIRALPAGSRALQVRLDGYAPWSRGVQVVANRFTTVVARLNPAKTPD